MSGLGATAAWLRGALAARASAATPATTTRPVATPAAAGGLGATAAWLRDVLAGRARDVAADVATVAPGATASLSVVGRSAASDLERARQVALAVRREAKLLSPGRPPRRARLGARAVLCGILAGYGLLSWRLHHLQVVEHERWSEAAERQHMRERVEPAERGRVLAQDGDRLVPVAVSLGRGSLLVEGRASRDVTEFMRRLEAALGPEAALTAEERGFVADRLQRAKAFYFRRRAIEPEVCDRLRRARLSHTTLEVDAVRAYPFGPLAVQVLGIAGVDSRSRAGLEAVFDRALTGTAGHREVRIDNLRRELVVPGASSVPAIPGHDVILSLDRTIQAAADAELAALAAESKPLGAAAVVVDCRTGDVLALSSYPTFDPQRPTGEALAQGMRCRAISDTYEPGSTIKPLFIGTAWELGLGGPDRPIDCPKTLRVPNRRKAIEDHHHVGHVLESDVIVQSSNTGAYQITARLSGEQVLRMAQGFGLGRRSGIELPDESGGNTANLARRDPTTVGSYAQGYAFCVTPLQMAMAYAALGNGGTLWRPRLVREVRDRNGQVVQRFDPQPVGRPLSGPVVRGALRAALERVVSDDHGTARRAKSDTWRIAGKTGTTKLLVDGHYHEREVVASFAGFAPAEDPRIAFCVVVWGPSTAKAKAWGGTIAAPVAGRIADQALSALRVPPSPPVEETAPPR